MTRERAKVELHAAQRLSLPFVERLRNYTGARVTGSLIMADVLFAEAVQGGRVTSSPS